MLETQIWLNTIICYYKYLYFKYFPTTIINLSINSSIYYDKPKGVYVFFLNINIICMNLIPIRYSCYVK